MSRALRSARVRFNKVRGVKNEESSALIRLADAMCGFVRAVYENQPEMLKFFEHATRAGMVRDVSPK